VQGPTKKKTNNCGRKKGNTEVPIAVGRKDSENVFVVWAAKDKEKGRDNREIETGKK